MKTRWLFLLMLQSILAYTVDRGSTYCRDPILYQTERAVDIISSQMFFLPNYAKVAFECTILYREEVYIFNPSSNSNTKNWILYLGMSANVSFILNAGLVSHPMRSSSPNEIVYYRYSLPLEYIYPVNITIKGPLGAKYTLAQIYAVQNIENSISTSTAAIVGTVLCFVIVVAVFLFFYS